MLLFLGAGRYPNFLNCPESEILKTEEPEVLIRIFTMNSVKESDIK